MPIGGLGDAVAGPLCQGHAAAIARQLVVRRDLETRIAPVIDKPETLCWKQ